MNVLAGSCYTLNTMGRNRKDGQKGHKEKSSDDKSSRFDLSLETKNGIWMLISFVAAVLSILAFSGNAGRAGEIFNSAIRTLFGWGFFIVPMAFLLLAAAFLKSYSKNTSFGAILGTSLLVLGFLGILFVLRDVNFVTRLEQGGYLGLVLGYPLLQLSGVTAAMIILAALMFVSILIALDIPLHHYLLSKSAQSQEEARLTGAVDKEKLVIKQGDKIVSAATFNQKEPDTSQKPLLFDKKEIVSIPTAVAIKRALDKPGEEFTVKFGRSGLWELPSLDLLEADSDTPRAGDIAASASIIKRTLANFNIDVEMGEVNVGPTVTQYTLRPAVGVKLSKITTLRDNMSLALASHPLRIEAPIPGKSLVGIEVPNKKSALVRLRNLLQAEEFQNSHRFLSLALGRDVAGFPVIVGLEKMPHLLIAGSTGSGKSIGINAALLSLLYKHSPDFLNLILIDPKRVELTLYNGIPHLIAPVIVEAKKAINALRWAVSEMEHRYEILQTSGSRDIFSYNQKYAKKSPMRFIVIVIDELADLMAAYGREVETSVVRLAQMARAVGIHLLISTQRPSVEVITGLIKANITSRVAFQVASQVDSRTILDMAGAETLLGNGDLLFLSGELSKPRRIQGAFVSEKEVRQVVRFLKEQEYYTTDTSLSGEVLPSTTLAQSQITDYKEASVSVEEDELYQEAIKLVMESQKASASYLQRRLRVGYARAARLLDMMEENGLVGPADGSKAREILVGSRIQTAESRPVVNIRAKEEDDSLV